MLVGRGVREGAVTAEIASDEVAPDRGHGASGRQRPAAAPPAGSSPSQAPAAPPAEELSYAERLLRDTPPEEDLETVGAPRLRPCTGAGRTGARRAEGAGASAAAAAPKERTPPPAAAAPAPAAPAPQTVKPTPVPAAAALHRHPIRPVPGFAVQVAAYRDRRDADTLAKQLAAKGYPAFVMDPVKGTSTALFRVRVGKYKTLKDAEAVEARLQTAEQFTNAWIAR